MTTASRSWRILWYLLIATPLLALAAGISACMTARSADESLGQVFVVMPFEFAALLIALVVLVATLRARAMSREERALSLATCGALAPMYVLIMVTVALLGWPRSDSWRIWAAVLTLLNGAWLWVMLELRRRARRIHAGE